VEYGFGLREEFQIIRTERPRRFSRHDLRVQRDWCLSRDAGGVRKPDKTQSSSAEVPSTRDLSGRQRFPAKSGAANGAVSAFRSPRTIFIQIMGHGSLAFEKTSILARRTLRWMATRVFRSLYRPADCRHANTTATRQSVPSRSGSRSSIPWNSAAEPALGQIPSPGLIQSPQLDHRNN